MRANGILELGLRNRGYHRASLFWGGRTPLDFDWAAVTRVRRYTNHRIGFELSVVSVTTPRRSSFFLRSQHARAALSEL